MWRMTLVGCVGLCCSAGNAQEVPLAIAGLPAEVQQAWRDIQEAVSENEQLESPLPEPYFSRAEIWTAAKNYDAAMRDYLKAIELAANGGGDPSAYAGWLSKLAVALDNLDKAPRPAGKGDARRHYSSGVHAFWDGDLKNAAWHFDNAIFVEPGNSLFWYYRALTHLRGGDRRRAKHDALIGSNLEWKDGRKDRIGWAFVRLQGPMRMWVERYRAGDPSQRVVTHTGY